MRIRLLAFVVLFTMCGLAAACQRIVQTTLTFADGAADLDGAHIVKLVEWIDRSRSMFAKYDAASVEGGASMESTGMSLAATRKLAKQRAANTARALRMLLPAELPIDLASHAYRRAKQFGVSSNDFASVQLYPDAALNLPDCSPTPMPGLEFKR